MRQLTWALTCAFLASSTYGHGQTHKWQVHCTGLRSVTTKVTPSSPEIKQDRSTDEIWITRKGSVLLLQINPTMYSTLDPKVRRELQQPDEYMIVGETGEGLTALHVASLPTTEQTFILRSDDQRAIWIETAFSFLPPQSELLSTTVSFDCKRVK